MDTYEEPLILLDNNFNIIAEYENIEKAVLDTSEDVQDIYYTSNAVNLGKHWILKNAKNIDNAFGNYECKLSEIYKSRYKNNYDKIESYLI